METEMKERILHWIIVNTCCRENKGPISNFFINVGFWLFIPKSKKK